MNTIRTVGIVGAGTMGLGIAQVCAMAGFNTILFDVQQDQVKNAFRVIEKNISYLVEKGKLNENRKTDILSRVVAAPSLSDLKADMIIEAAVERLDIKQQLFLDLEKINRGEAILATNTSSISVTEIAQKLSNPSRCIGYHFFNPADRMKLVEIISGKETDPALVQVLKEFSLLIQKIAVLAKDSPGFIVNRVARHFYVESLKLLEENVCSVNGIDELLRSAGFKMGPFELMDLIGVDTNLAVTTSVYNGFHQAAKFKPSPIQQQLVKEGHFGRKTGKGFYNY
ncbi:MAG: 3-hydroxybutyryl-CoA dehydrogenase [Cyclobacteriaceae bacterium]|nr:3-hydroxybutyryl-CoA dehydrogenase [Cyclobacteriaceae bacterium]